MAPAASLTCCRIQVTHILKRNYAKSCHFFCCLANPPLGHVHWSLEDGEKSIMEQCIHYIIYCIIYIYICVVSSVINKRLQVTSTFVSQCHKVDWMDVFNHHTNSCLIPRCRTDSDYIWQGSNRKTVPFHSSYQTKSGHFLPHPSLRTRPAAPPDQEHCG